MSAATPLPAESSTQKAFNALLFRGLLFSARPDQDARHAVVPFVTGGIEDHLAAVIGLSHLDENGPRLGPRLGIVESDFAAQIIGVHAPEAFDHLISIDVRSTET